MNERLSLQSRALGLVALWSVPGLLQAVQEATYASAQGQSVRTLGLLLQFVPSWYPWALWTPVVVYASRRFWPRPGDRLRPILVHTSLCVVLGVSHLVLIGLLRTSFPMAEWSPTDLGVWLRGAVWSLMAQAEVLAYVGVVATGRALTAARTVRERDLRAARLEGQLARARIAALRHQLQPHFLFNALNAIGVVMREDVDVAERMLLRLSDLLRGALERSGSTLVSLEDELAQLDNYLALEQLRFSDRLRVRREIADGALSAQVPTMLLQPLVENAVRHGISRSEEGGCIEITATRQGGRLRIEVSDDGAGLAPDHGEGIGLTNTRERLREHYGADQELRIEARSEGGTRVLVEFPEAVTT